MSKKKTNCCFKPLRFGIECYCSITNTIMADTLHIFGLTEIEHIFLFIDYLCFPFNKLPIHVLTC